MDRLREAVRWAYSAAADHPEAKHAFPVGRSFAESLGYPEALLDDLPETAVDGFAGVTNLSLTAPITPGAVVLDLGCGAGLDALIAARRTGPGGRVLGLDFSEAMLRRAAASPPGPGIAALFCRADAERLPLRAASIDLALVNGLFNLNPAREAILGELGRVVRPGGALRVAELVLTAPVARAGPVSEADWFA